jgi:uncharacterized protein (DUF2141 family)
MKAIYRIATFSCLLACSFSAALPAAPKVCISSTATAAPPLCLHVQGLRVESITPQAQLYVAIYRVTKKTHWSDEPVWKTQLTISVARQWAKKFGVDELPYGRYAARAYIDQNGNGQLDQRGARPSEPFAISVGQGRTKPSLNMQRAAFIYNAEQHDVNISLRYP